MRMITSEPLAAVDVALCRLVLYGHEEAERQLGPQWRPPWLPRTEIMSELTYVEALEFKKSGSLPLRVRHLERPRTSRSVGQAGPY